MRHRLTLLLPLLLAACNGFPSSNKAETNSSNSSTTTTTVNMVNAAAPAAPPPVDANTSGNVALPDGNQSVPVPPASNNVGNGNEASPNANDRVGGRELDEGASNLDFIVVNRTGHKIIGLSIKPFDDNHWSNNVLAGRDVADKERAAATYSRDVEICRWDMKATFDNGTTRVFPNFNLCDTVRVELR